MNVDIFCDIAPCSPYVNRRFGLHGRHIKKHGNIQELDSQGKDGEMNWRLEKCFRQMYEEKGLQTKQTNSMV
jgi:hypothetical protein